MVWRTRACSHATHARRLLCYHHHALSPPSRHGLLSARPPCPSQSRHSPLAAPACQHEGLWKSTPALDTRPLRTTRTRGDGDQRGPRKRCVQTAHVPGFTLICLMQHAVHACAGHTRVSSLTPVPPSPHALTPSQHDAQAPIPRAPIPQTTAFTRVVESRTRGAHSVHSPAVPTEHSPLATQHTHGHENPPHRAAKTAP